MKTAAIGLLVLVGAMLAPVPVAQAGKSPPMIKLPRAGFELIGHDRGINVYQNDGSDMIWVAAVGVIPAPIDKVESALLDFERQVGKIGRLSEAKVLATDKDGLWVYERLNLPVIDDRDFTARVTHGTEGARHWIAYGLANDRGPAPHDGVVRVARQRGAWDLVAMPDGKGTLARYELRIDLGGSVPLWMVKSHAAEELPELFGEVCRLSLPTNDQGKCQ